MPRKCQTCYPKKLGIKHTITTLNGVIFHYDMCNRPVIIASPQEHMTEFPHDKDFLGNLSQTILQFCSNWNFTNYSLVWDIREYNINHIKVKIFIQEQDKDKLKSMKDIHFDVINRSKYYS